MLRLPLSLLIALKSREYARNEKLSRSELEAMQLRKFRHLARFAVKHSPYYADLVKARSIDIKTCKPEDFPVLTKSELMLQFDRIVTDRRVTKRAVSDFLEQSKDPTDLFLNEIYVVHTSGSSGEVGIFVFSKEDWARGLAQMGRHAVRPSRLKRHKTVSFTATGGHYAAISWTSILRQKPFKNYFDLLTLDINSPLPQVIDQLNAFQPDSLGGYVSGTLVLAEKQREGILDISPAFITLGGEVLTEHDKAEIEDAFGCPVINYYGSSEHMYMGRSLPGNSAIHLWEDDLIFELHDDHTIVTNLFNFTLPLIRYRMEDILIPKENKSSNWPYLEIDGVVGRLENAPKFINGDGIEDFISPHTINEIFIPGVKRFQMQLLSKTSFSFKVCLHSSLNRQEQIEAIAMTSRRLEEILKQKRMENVKFDIVSTGDLQIDPASRKFRLILDAP
jgi:phenylacetate-coenzyme A ligase PaaK-like adenylate-forming protein